MILLIFAHGWGSGVGVKLALQTKWVGDILRATVFFSSWPEPILSKLSEGAELWRYNKGERIGERYDPCPGLHMVVSGSLSLFRNSPSGRHLLFGIAHPGDVIGLASLLDSYVRPETVEARSDALLVFLPKPALDPAMADVVCLRSLARAVAFRWRILHESYHTLAMDSVRCRIAKNLAYLPRRSTLFMSFGPPGTQALIEPSPVDVTQSEIAAMMGMARQTVNRVLSEFLRKGIVARDGEAIRVISFKGLLAVMEEDEPAPADWRAEILSWDEQMKAEAKNSA